jgi:hypothetical protein
MMIHGFARDGAMPCIEAKVGPFKGSVASLAGLELVRGVPPQGLNLAMICQKVRSGMAMAGVSWGRTQICHENKHRFF